MVPVATGMEVCTIICPRSELRHSGAGRNPGEFRDQPGAISGLRLSPERRTCAQRFPNVPFSWGQALYTAKINGVIIGMAPKISPDVKHIGLKKVAIFRPLPPAANMGARELATVSVKTTMTTV